MYFSVWCVCVSIIFVRKGGNLAKIQNVKNDVSACAIEWFQRETCTRPWPTFLKIKYLKC